MKCKRCYICCSGGIILDTVSLSPEAGRATPKDEKMVTQLEQILQDIDRQKVFDSLQDAKSDVSCEFLKDFF